MNISPKTFLTMLILGDVKVILIFKKWDFPGGPLAKTPYSQCRGPGFNPWSGN